MQINKKLMLLLSKMDRIIQFFMLFSQKLRDFRNLLLFLICHIVDISLFQSIITNRILKNMMHFFIFLIIMVIFIILEFIQILHPCLIVFHHYLLIFHFYFLMEQTFIKIYIYIKIKIYINLKFIIT